MESINNIVEFTLPKTPFSVLKLQDLETNGQLKDYLDAQNYIFSFYYELPSQQYYFYNVDEDDFEIKTNEDFRRSVLDKLTKKDLIKCLKRNGKIFNVITEIGKKSGK